MRWILASLFLAIAAPAQGEWRSLFDGRSLEGWDGSPDHWRVEGGAIVGESTREKPATENTFLVWRGGEPGDFEHFLDAEVRRGRPCPRL